MPSLRLLTTLVLLAGLGAGRAGAQTGEVAQLSDAQVRHAIVLALRHLHKALCGETNCAPATADEVSEPPISLAQARMAISTGVLSGTAQWCGLDWQRGLFLPMIDGFVKEHQADDRQRALVALLHGIYQGQVYLNLNPRGACPEEIKSRMEKRLAPG